MIDYTTTFHEVPISEINRDIKDGKWILKSQGNIKGDIKAQTVVVYGDIKGNIKANQVVIINGNATGNINAETVVGLKDKQKKEKFCDSCKFLYNPCGSQYIDYCERLKMTVLKKGETCKFYQERKGE